MLHKVVKYGAKIRFARKKSMRYTTKMCIYKCAGNDVCSNEASKPL
jgi:hypothetical protein